MSADVPVVMGKGSWLAIVAQLIIIGLLFYLFYALQLPLPFVFAAFTYALFARLLRSFIATAHRKGIRLMMQKRYAEAIPFFEASHTYFTKNTWVDKYRFITLLSSVQSSYTQMALDNIAFCYSQTGDKLKAIACYKKALDVNPNDGIALAALNMLQADDISK